jgi:hypothetical protein
LKKKAVVAQLVEHFHGKEKVASSILANGSNRKVFRQSSSVGKKHLTLRS